MPQVAWNGEVLDLEFHTYMNGRKAIQAHDSDGFPYCTVTVNLPDVPDEFLGVVADTHDCELKDVLIIKDYNENSGILAAMVEAGIVRDANLLVPAGWVRANIAILLPQSTND